MKKLSEFWKNIEFDYFKTYSGLRGSKYHFFKEVLNTQLKELKDRMPTARFMEQSKIQKQIKNIKDDLELYNSWIIKMDGTLHPTTEDKSTIYKEDSMADRLGAIFNIKAENPGLPRCPSIYRDAIVFYSAKNEIIEIIFICFECATVIDSQLVFYEFDENIYVPIKEYLFELGHNIKA